MSIDSSRYFIRHLRYTTVEESRLGDIFGERVKFAMQFNLPWEAMVNVMDDISYSSDKIIYK